MTDPPRTVTYGARREPDPPEESPRAAHQADRLGVACAWCRNPWPCDGSKGER